MRLLNEFVTVMNTLTTESIRKTFLYELEKNYDCECRVASMLPDLIRLVHSKKLKRQLTSFLDGAGLSFGKLAVLFHLVNYRIKNTDNKVVTDMIEECRAVRINLSARMYDVIVLAHLQQILHAKVAGYNAMVFCAVKLKNRAAYTILNEMLNHENQAIRDFEDTMTKLLEPSREALEVKQQRELTTPNQSCA